MRALVGEEFVKGGYDTPFEDGLITIYRHSALWQKSQ